MTQAFTVWSILRRAFPSFVWIVLIAGLIGLVPGRADAGPQYFTDDSGYRLELAAPARRIVALYGAFNDILLDMGLGDRLAARTLADTRTELEHLPAIGTHMRPNSELIAALQPDLVLQFEGRREAENQVARLRALGLPVVVFRGSGFPDLFRIIESLGLLTGEEKAAADLVEGLRSRLDAVARSREGAPRPRVFFEIRSPNLLAAGTDSMASAIIEAAGGENAVTVPDRVARLNEEEVIRLDPDVYLIQRGPMNPDPVPPAQRSHYRSLKAVREDRILEVDESLFSRPAPGAVLAVEQLAAFFQTLSL